MTTKASLGIAAGIALALHSLVLPPDLVFASYGPAVSLLRPNWFWSSVPLYDMGDPAKPPIQPLITTHNRLQWYNARNVKEGDLKPLLSQSEGGQNEHTVLELNVLPATGQTTIDPTDWTGTTQSLSISGQDFSKLKYLELWVNDFTPDHTGTHAKLHIDFGRVSEDAFWSPDSLPNGRLDTEDKNGDGKLDRSEDLAVDEDTGLDGLHDVEEPGYDATTNPDPNHDDYNFDSSKSPPDYSQINNQEGNGVGDPNAHLDTEDLNRNGRPDFHDDYFELAIDLSDTSFVAIDVPKDYANDPNVETPIQADNGWRLFRAPLNNEVFSRVNLANWEYVPEIRLWVNGATAPLRLQFGGFEFLDSLGRAAPRAVYLAQNHPNPFNPATTIRYELPEPTHVTLRIYDARGRLVRVLEEGDRPPGYHEVSWAGTDASGRPVASGVYWYRLEAGGTTETHAMVLVR